MPCPRGPRSNEAGGDLAAGIGDGCPTGALRRFMLNGFWDLPFWHIDNLWDRLHVFSHHL